MIVGRDLGFYLKEKVISLDAVRNGDISMGRLVRELAGDAGEIIEQMNVPSHALHAPIAGDYVKYNKEEHFGEVVNAKL